MPAAKTGLKVISRKKATTVNRNPTGPWEWPDVVDVMVSDSYKVLGASSLKATNGGPLENEFAVNFVESLYKNGFVIAKPSK